MKNLLKQFNENQKRIEKAEKYMDKPYNEKWQCERLEQGIKEREKHVKKLRELQKEQTLILKKLSEED